MSIDKLRRNIILVSPIVSALSAERKTDLVSITQENALEVIWQMSQPSLRSVSLETLWTENFQTQTIPIPEDVMDGWKGIKLGLEKMDISLTPNCCYSNTIPITRKDLRKAYETRAKST